MKIRFNKNYIWQISFSKLYITRITYQDEKNSNITRNVYYFNPIKEIKKRIENWHNNWALEKFNQK